MFGSSLCDWPACIEGHVVSLCDWSTCIDEHIVGVSPLQWTECDMHAARPCKYDDILHVMYQRYVWGDTGCHTCYGNVRV